MFSITGGKSCIARFTVVKAGNTASKARTAPVDDGLLNIYKPPIILPHSPCCEKLARFNVKPADSSAAARSAGDISPFGPFLSDIPSAIFCLSARSLYKEYIAVRLVNSNILFQLSSNLVALIGSVIILFLPKEFWLRFSRLDFKEKLSINTLLPPYRIISSMSRINGSFAAISSITFLLPTLPISCRTAMFIALLRPFLTTAIATSFRYAAAPNGPTFSLVAPIQALVNVFTTKSFGAKL